MQKVRQATTDAKFVRVILGDRAEIVKRIRNDSLVQPRLFVLRSGRHELPPCLGAS
jgi:hypothetical protein